jgi:hypothetical protein
VKTHYDNLQVSRNASDRVIRAAYKSLSQQWHPDKNLDNLEEAERISKIINEAYRVLSDPILRKEHDDWIAENDSNETRDKKPNKSKYKEDNNVYQNSRSHQETGHRERKEEASAVVLCSLDGEFLKVRLKEIEGGAWGKYRGKGSVIILETGITIVGSHVYSNVLRWHINVLLVFLLFFLLGSVWPALIFLPVTIWLLDHAILRKSQVFIPWHAVKKFVIDRDIDSFGVAVESNEYLTPIYFRNIDAIRGDLDELHEIFQDKLLGKQILVDKLQPLRHGF